MLSFAVIACIIAAEPARTRGYTVAEPVPWVVYPQRMAAAAMTPEVHVAEPPHHSHSVATETTKAASPAWNTSGLVGAEYTPWRVGNQLWWHNFTDYSDDVAREVKMMRTVYGFTAIRVFLHDMLFFNDSTKLKSNMDTFLGILDAEGMKAGFVFFDDCWQHSGANLSTTCIPRQGVHNGCWYAAPQDVDRTSVDRFEPYVKEIVSAFATDKRVAWFEIFNEPQKGNPYSMALRDAGFRWATAANPMQPVISCWDDNNDTQVVDQHKYSAPWGGAGQGVFSNPAKGGIVTEAGCRWFQQDKDHGSPLTVVNWLDAIRRGGPGAGNAPFSPGVMVAWEVMVGNSATRWGWLSKEGDAEPAVPWCGMLYPDGTPVSYTEAAAFRSYLGHGDDFMYLNTWLEPSVAAAETYLTIASGSTWESGWKPAGQLSSSSSSSSSGGGSNGGYAGALFEVAVWAISGDGALHIEAGGFNISLSVTKEPRNCTATNYLGCFQEGKRPGFVLPVFPINNARSTMTNKLCASLCKDANFKPYPNSGTERGHYCMCGKVDTVKWKKLNDTRCSTPCTGDKREKCGGEPAPGGTGDAVSAYEIACTGGDPSPQLTVSETVGGGGAGKVLGNVAVGDRMMGVAWNILRVLVEPDRVRAWLNPTFADVTGGSVPPNDLKSPPHAPAPLLDVQVPAAAAKRNADGRIAGVGVGFSAFAEGGAWALDYASVLPPTLFGEQ